MYNKNLKAAQAFMYSGPSVIYLNIKRNNVTVRSEEAYLTESTTVKESGNNIFLELVGNKSVRFAVQKNDVIEEVVVHFVNNRHTDARQARHQINQTANANGIFHLNELKIEWK